MQIAELKKALELEDYVVNTKSKLSMLKKQKFFSRPKAPVKPQKRVVDLIPYPEPISNLTLGEHLKTVKPWIWIVGVIFTYGILDIYLLYQKYNEFKQLKENDVESIKNSEEYLSKCSEIDKANADNQAQAEAEYQKQIDDYNQELENFNKTILAKYDKERDEWTEKQNAEINDVEVALSKAEKDLKSHYEESNFLPAQYRKRSIVRYIYETMTTSEYDVFQAIESYDRKVQQELESQRLLEQQRLKEQQERANQIAYEQAVWQQEQALRQQEQNAIAEQRRRDTALAIGAAATGVAIGHHTKKKKEKESKYQDFMGSASCIYGKKLDKYTRGKCNLQCPVYDYCTRGGAKFKK